MQIQSFFDNETATFCHIVSDTQTRCAAVIDPVFNYDQFSGRTSTKSADEIIHYLTQHNLKLEWLLETHIHADHLTAAHYIKQKLGGKIAIGANINKALAYWVPIFHTENDTPLNGSQFDKLFVDNESFSLGCLTFKVLNTPGHTPMCVSYLVEDAIFVGDTIFMPDVGTARTDFPGGSAKLLYHSIQRILALPDETRIFLCHDYPTNNRQATAMIKVKDQKTKNILINEKITEAEYIQTREKRDEGKAVPKLLLPAIQFNLRAGSFGLAESNHTHYIKIPINKI